MKLTENPGLKHMKSSSPFSAKCIECERVKHKQKFKRFNGFYHICNECFLERKNDND